MVDRQDDSLQHSVVLPAPHRRGPQERGAAGKQRARYWFELQFGVVRLLNIATWSNSEDGNKHTDFWTRFVSEHPGLHEGFAGSTDNIRKDI